MQRPGLERADMAKAKLTPKQEQFCQEYLIDLNATQAAIRAGYSKKGANVQANNLLTNINIQENIQKLQDARSKRTEIDQDYVIQGLRAVAERCSQPEYYNASGANTALIWLGKHLAMFKDVTEYTGKITHTVKTYHELKEMANDVNDSNNRIKEHIN